ncbi:MAG TPA: DUF4340 domain-containing protein [Polyangiaceae bacterium]|nr:DUF4340 domain-containing protein [Polyangiaceae bacterium]
MKALVFHGGALVVAAALAIGVWTKDESTSKQVASAQVEIWGGSPDQIELISFDAPARKVRLEAKKDEQGRYYVASVEKESSKPAMPPHHPAVDGGAAEPDAPEPEKKRETQRFIAVKQADDLANKLAPLMAVRTVGKIEGGRAEEFGLDKPDGTLKVKIGGKENALVIGAATGGQERYAKLLSTGVVYAVPGDIAQSMLAAESKLLERAFHGFDDVEVTRVKISKGGKSREAVRPADKKTGWADSANPGKLDETIGNYMTKVNGLKVLEYIEKPSAPLRPEDAVVRVDFFGGMKPLGFIELYKVPGEKGNEYLARSEQARWYVKVLSSLGEPVEQDLSGVLK